MLASLDEHAAAYDGTDLTIEINGYQRFYTSRSYISQMMPLNFTWIDLTGIHSTMNISLRAFDGPHPGFNITVFLVPLYVKEEPETFHLSPLGQIGLFAFFICNEIYFKLLHENRCI